MSIHKIISLIQQVGNDQETNELSYRNLVTLKKQKIKLLSKELKDMKKMNMSLLRENEMLLKMMKCSSRINVNDKTDAECTVNYVDLTVDEDEMKNTKIKEEKNNFEETSRFHPFNVITVEDSEQEQIDADKRRSENLKSIEIKKEKRMVVQQDIIESNEEVSVEEEEVGVEEEEVSVEEEEVGVEEEEVGVEEEEVGVEEEEVSVEEEEVSVEEEEVSVEEEVEEEVYMVTIDGTKYYTTNEKDGMIYEVTSDGEVGEELGFYEDGEPGFYD